jgi:uncharacterized LabA/DUF88 family protein
MEDLRKLIRSMEKVAIFIDNSNLYGAMQTLPDAYEKRIDYVKLKSFLADDRTVNNALFYYSEPPRLNEWDEGYEEIREAVRKRQGFYYVLEKAGYKTVCLPQRQQHDGYSEKGLDTILVYDMCALSRSGKYDTFILVAGDGDYTLPVQKIKEDTGISVEVAFFGGPGNCSSHLQSACSKFIDLGKEEAMEEIFRKK